MAKNPAGEQFEMSFFDHLEELRLRIGLAVLGIVIGCIIAGAFVDQLMNWVLLKPAASVNMELQNLRPFGQAFLYFGRGRFGCRRSGLVHLFFGWYGQSRGSQPRLGFRRQRNLLFVKARQIHGDVFIGIE